MRTPGPWKQDGLKISVKGRGLIAACPTPQNGGVFDCSANAAFIVLACNSHERLVESLRALVRTCEEAEARGDLNDLIGEAALPDARKVLAELGEK